RLALFVSVCRAVQHAHQKGIIHRDLKPSNVLVAPHDGVPVVKVIDFGVAKAIGQRLTDKTVYTHFTQMIGTPLYMSPEQAELDALDVDVRSDVYSLGVLLYELLTGTTPFDRERFAQLGYGEMRGIIRTTWSLIRATAAQGAARNEADQKARALEDKQAALAAAQQSERQARDQLSLALLNHARANRSSRKMGQRLDTLATLAEAAR